MNLYGPHLSTLIDKAVEANAEDGFRTHLGASQIGEQCWRKIWFGFRWADKEEFSGRMLRLFERGQLEELRFVKLLNLVGAKVFIHDDDGKQFRVSEFGGHFGGSCDGVAVNLPDINEPVLCEFKTHNSKSFSKLVSEGVHNAKPNHVKQAQVYAYKLNLKKILYVAINKDNEELHFELFDADSELAKQQIEKAEMIIFKEGLPPRISDTPTFWECRFCFAQKICFKYKQPHINCRTCRHSKPERDGSWSCAKGKEEIGTQPKVGCGEHEFMPELV